MSYKVSYFEKGKGLFVYMEKYGDFDNLIRLYTFLKNPYNISILCKDGDKDG